MLGATDRRLGAPRNDVGTMGDTRESGLKDDAGGSRPGILGGGRY